MKKIYAFMAVVLVAAITPPSSVQAHSPYHSDYHMGSGMMSHGSGHHGMMRGYMMGYGTMNGPYMRHGQMHSMALGRLAYLKAELKITEDQEDVWNKYADVTKEKSGAFEGMHREMMQDREGSDVISRMDNHIRAMEAMLEGYKAIKPATEALYKALSADQKKTADQILFTCMGCGAM